MEFPRYRCHKIVQALKIFDVARGENGGGLLFPHDPQFSPVSVSAQWMEKHNPRPEAEGLETRGYFVIYEDGYQSWSPVKAFEDGYTLLHTPDGDEK